MIRVVSVAILLFAATACWRERAREATPAGVRTQLRQVYGLILEDFRFEEALRRLSDLDGHVAEHPESRAAATVHQYRAICYQRLFRFPEAISEYLTARRTAAAAGDALLASTAAHNLSNLHLQAFSLGPALAAAEDAIALFPANGPPESRLRMEIHLARLRARASGIDGATERFRSLLHRAAQMGDASLEAWVWESLGTEYLVAGRLEPADQALSNAYRIRTLKGDPEAALSLWWIGELRLKQGDPEAALRVFDAASRRGRHLGALLADWREPYMRALANRSLGRREEALAYFRRAVRAIDGSRAHLLQADVWRVDLASRLDEVFDAYVETLLLQGNRPPDVNELAQSVLSRRAVTLRTDPGWASRVRRLLPGEYWSALGRLGSLRARLLHSPSAGLETEIERTRARLAELESAAGAAPILSTDAGAGSLAGLAHDRAVLAFHAGRNHVIVLAGTAAGGWRMARLAAGAEIERQVREFAQAVEQNTPAAVDEGERLYDTLFGSLPADARALRHWTLVLDEDLYKAPFAALVTGRSAGRVRYLAETHSIRLSSGVRTQPLTRTRARPVFLGVGDPVYNSADPRFAREVARPAVELPRLPGSGLEIEACAELFPDRSLLTGPKATLDGLAAALEPPPEVIHIATHALPAPDSPRETLLALSLGPAGNPDLVSSEWIASRPAAPRLVVMSGCRSGSGEILPGEGLMGLTRAWLYAGAEAVVATYWPIVDDSGELAVEFYRQWGGMRGPGIAPEEALRRAQVAMISQGGWKAEPRYWGAYFVSGAGK
jgi:CHAT domain-containing protein